MNLETVITEKVRSLPVEKQRRVLESIEEIEREEAVLQEPDFTKESETVEKAGRLALVGQFDSGKREISERAEEILFEEITKRSGWTLK